MPVGHVVIEQAGTFFSTHCAPEQAGGVDAHAKNQRRGDKTWQQRK